MNRSVATIVMLFLCLNASAYGETREIGTVTRTQSDVVGELADVRRDLQKDLSIFAEETVRTGESARVGLLFKDGSELIIGATAHVVLDKFVYDGNGAKGANVDGVINLLKGAMRFTSGRLGHRSLRVVTPVATIGIRGTDFWVGQIDGVYGVLLLSGAVEVSNDGGTVTLDEPLQGTTIFSQTVAPDRPGVWPGDRRARALAGVTFN
ncbi:MAG: FecR family protein [Alphaproteobacteria bacterium]|nr:FecR family protein [Alphaproteobacteria bacterium]